MNDPTVHWTEHDAEHTARWWSTRDAKPPVRIEVVDDSLTADAAYRLATTGTAMLWRGDFHNARQLARALTKRVDDAAARREAKRQRKGAAPASLAEAFHRMRQVRAQRSQLLHQLLVPVAADHTVPLRRAPDTTEALTSLWGPPSPDGALVVLSLRDLTGIRSAHGWRVEGVEVPALGEPPHNRIHPHHGVFSPVRGEYIDLVARAPLPATDTAVDVGTGTGVLAAVLARRGVARVVATELDPGAVACARDNLARLGLDERVQVLHTDLFPEGQAGLVVCNPPWIPARPTGSLDRAVYDDDSAMLRGFLAGLAAHLAPGGEGWLVLSDIAEHLGLRTRGALMAWIEDAGLKVVDRLDARPTHDKAADPTDPLHEARAAEVTSLWRLAVR